MALDPKLLTPEQKARVKRVRIKQEGGDDGYCWVMRIDGRAVYNGMQRREAEYRRNLWIKDGVH